MTPATQHACLASLLLFTASGICFAQGSAADIADSDRMVTTHRAWLQGVSLDLTRLYHDQPSDAQAYEQLQQKLTQLIHGC